MFEGKARCWPRVEHLPLPANKLRRLFLTSISAWAIFACKARSLNKKGALERIPLGPALSLLSNKKLG